MNFSSVHVDSCPWKMQKTTVHTCS